MRLRNVKGSREQIAANEYTIKDAEQIKGQWKDYFQDGKPIQLEIGMGKGKFLMQLAEKNPQIHYIGIEKYSSVLVRALEKMEENPLENLHFIRMDAENIVNVFEKGEVDQVYLNFSDPWPKDRHAKKLASSVIREDRLDKDPPDLIAGADVGFEQGGEVTRAAMVLLKYPSLELVEYKVARIATTMPYIPGFLSFREYPALLAAWEMLSQKPDLVFVDGHGISHPRRLGVASHFGLLVDVPTIGVAKKRLCGKFEPLSSEPGALAPLMDKGEQLAWVWRSKARCNPLFIATGHRVSVDSALAWVQRCMKGYRLPEPTRWADAVASERPAFVRYTANQP